MQVNSTSPPFSMRRASREVLGHHFEGLMPPNRRFEGPPLSYEDTLNSAETWNNVEGVCTGIIRIPTITISVTI